MSDERWSDGVLKLLELLADRLDHYLEGDDAALETLVESIEQQGFSSDDVQSVVLVLRSLGGSLGGAPALPDRDLPGKHALRVPSAEERDRITPEAWGYLLGLKRRGSLDAEQFERVVDLLSGCGIRPVGLDVASDVASRVALEFDDAEPAGEDRRGDFDLAH